MLPAKTKSRTFRRVSVKTPGGKTVTHFRRRKPSHAVCADCGAVLKGVPRDIPSKVNKLSKTQKRPERPYGGVLCSKCAREKIRQEALAK